MRMWNGSRRPCVALGRRLCWEAAITREKRSGRMRIRTGRLLVAGTVLLACGALWGARSAWAGPAQLAAVPGEKRPEDVAAIRAHLDRIFQGFIHQDGAALRAGHSTDWRGFLE